MISACTASLRVASGASSVRCSGCANVICGG
ncbi:hypothetical protein EDS67_29325 [candidate division KSB1 bacterium]|nr:MAG: hypothetical protein EDS67_29325 [candidate division KSB1 bacterium]MBC6951764.1 hypothetical protein [candidate division KSB1 bacterium]MCE7945699.1 hypothetical protein [Chlorobi bacterium CHB1]MDL1877980.1 hypothetical protein [Cytophagia bacterium CHB2]